MGFYFFLKFLNSELTLKAPDLNFPRYGILVHLQSRATVCLPCTLLSGIFSTHCSQGTISDLLLTQGAEREGGVAVHSWVLQFGVHKELLDLVTSVLLNPLQSLLKDQLSIDHPRPRRRQPNLKPEPDGEVTSSSRVSMRTPRKQLCLQAG